MANDLISQSWLQTCLGDNDLSATQLSMLPQLTAAASRAIRRYCNRFFNRCPSQDATLPYLDGLYTLDWPSRTLLLRQYPVNRIKRVRTNPTLVIQVLNDGSVAQQATSSLISTAVADVDDLPPAVSGIELDWVASGVASSSTLLFSSYPTLQALAAAVSAVGSGWSAIVTTGYELWPTADLRTGPGPQPAIDADDRDGYYIHVDDIPSQLDARAGVLTLSANVNNPFTSPRFGMYLETDLDDVQVYGGLQGVRVIYDAGWDAIPEDVQDACVETVWHWLNLKTLDQTLSSESDGARSYAINAAFANLMLPKSVLGKLSHYRSPRA